MTSGRLILTAAALAALAALAPAAGAAAATVRPAAGHPNARPLAATVGTAYSVEEAGYQASGPGRHFRYAAATVRLPDSALSPYSRGEALSVQLRAASETIVLQIATTPGATAWNAAVAVERQFGQGGCTTKNGCFTHVNGQSPPFSTGDSVSFNLYYNKAAGTVYYTATDSTLGQAFLGWFGDPAELFTSARIGVEFGADPWTPGTGYTAPAKARVLASFTGVGFTAYSGSKGAIGGARWATSRVLATSTGTAGGTLIASPSVPASNGATAFTVSAAGK
jgi:hypothetical protein